MRDKDWDIIDEDLYEDIEPEEMYELVQEEKRKLQEKQEQEKEDKQVVKKRRPLTKVFIWFIAIAMFIQVIALIPNTFSIPAIQFLKTSASLLQDEEVAYYRQSVVVIEGQDNKGTGFIISTDGYVLTNHHVVEDQWSITVAIQDDGLYQAELVEAYPEIDLALLKIDAKDLTYLPLASNSSISEKEKVIFIGNPLRFNGIANKGYIVGTTQLSSWDVPVYMLEAPVYRGNSGSPVINEEGQVVAVIFATQRNTEKGKVGLAVPIDYFHDRNQHGY
ncbi:S1-C subfamily serine protease [Gracilibacillus halotolerans]|uniref:S1-C subfamily serine protease n=1 Tax=Gracilibacillus halotolerans TaxID=74386 RepID=A0A841RLG1_9BACI|nr:serine protease [Gracilibacillus halotolerans]MBB6512717.1 S1-C subfamily serine protease [Gracilibacillus halotolerans]